MKYVVRKFGIAAECLGNIPQKVELIKSAGFEAIFTGSYTRKEVEKYKKYSDGCNLDYSFIHAPFGNINSMWLEGEEYLAIYNEMKESVISAGTFGVPVVCIHVSSGWTPPKINEVGVGRFEELFELGYKNNVVIAIENQRLPSYLAFFMDRYKNNPTVKFCYDCGHEHCFTEGVEFAKLYGDRIACTHVHDNMGVSLDAGAFTDTHLLPFDGNLDFKKMKDGLDACGYKGGLTLEVSKKNKYFNYENLTDEEYLKKAYDSLKRISLL